jgi:hypothetical protein
VNPALLIQSKPVKPAKKERISSADLAYLKSRATLHLREMIDEFFPDGRLGPNEQYWITPELRVSISTGGVWKNFSQGRSRRPIGDVLTLFLIAKGFLVPVKPVTIEGLSEGQTRVEELKLKISAACGSRTGYYGFPEPESFAKGVESLSNWLEQFSARAEVHELVGYDS